MWWYFILANIFAFLFQNMFYSIESILKQFLDVDHLLSLCIKIPKNENIKSAESKITKV